MENEIDMYGYGNSVIRIHKKQAYLKAKDKTKTKQARNEIKV